MRLLDISRSTDISTISQLFTFLPNLAVYPRKIRARMQPPITWTLDRSQGIVFAAHCPGRAATPTTTQNQDQKIKIAAIDLNQTLIVSKSGTLHGKDDADWKWWHPNVPTKLRVLTEKGYTIIISSNQGRLTDLEGNEVPEAQSFKRKMEFVLRALDIPVTLIVACANDINRKPRPGLWSMIPKLTGNNGCYIDKQDSYIVGDAAGREADFSDSDLHWAMNADIPFYTPEEFFLGHKQEPRTHKFHPDWYLYGKEDKEPDADITNLRLSPIVVLIGLPGAGKTTFCRNVLYNLGFTRVDAWSYSSRQLFLSAVEDAISNDIPVIIDDMNLTVEDRSIWISMATKNGMPISAVFFNTSDKLCGHNDSVRAFGGELMNPENRPAYPRLQFFELVPCLQKPMSSERFNSVHEINFKWRGTDEELEIWKKFWL
ncbi:hypothetical protein VHEMI09151 [[Torrubiella] hemipterigena]|uniref:DNA kinase/phosphatase Pnk1 n=1 Tax=[Torrubiella] hemipterigena TaxID=1531966 RepID=A0A0A1TPT5_9HYPO|nr:hypothetical protein VHEMI09151 [[Torrubiella] hemipterigena]